MEKINIGTLDLCNFDKDNKTHLEFFKKLIKDKSISKRFQGLLNNLMKENDGVFDKGFLLSEKDTLIGYLDIGNYNKEEECVYLRSAIDKDLRGKSYGKTMLSEVSDYLFLNYPEIKQIKLKIAQDNIPSLKIAESCGYQWLKDDFYYQNNKYLKQSSKR